MRTISEIFSYTGEEEENHSPNQKEKKLITLITEMLQNALGMELHTFR